MKKKEYEQEKPKIASHKRKGRKLEFSNHKPDTSSEELVKHHKKQQELSESSDDNKKKIKYRPYEEISREFKKIKPPMFNGEIEKDKEAESWSSGMKKIIFIYTTTLMS